MQTHQTTEHPVLDSVREPGVLARMSKLGDEQGLRSGSRARMPLPARRREFTMPKAIRTGSFLLAILVVAACRNEASPGSSAETSSSPIAPAVTISAAAATTIALTPTSFTSETYRYTLTLPAGWTSAQASKTWDGKTGLKSDSAEVDQFLAPADVTSTGVAAPSDQTLAASTDALIAATVQYHSDTCPPTPEAQDPITIGGDPGMLVAWNCGILINIAVTVHNGVDYQFLWRNPAVHAATDPTDRSEFLSMLESVQFPV